MKQEPQRWRNDYEQNGYVVVENVVEPALLAQMRAQLDRICAAPRRLPEWQQRLIYFEKEYTAKHKQYNEKSAEEIGDAIRIIMDLPMFDRVFTDLIVYDPLLDVLETLFESTEFHFLNWKCVVKAPFVSSRFCWHRDLPYTNHTTPNLITAMLCLDDMTEENGATVVFPGTHRISHEQFDPADADIPDEKLPASERVTVKCPAGSAVLFHVNIIHGGGPNRSPVPRRNVISIWAGPDTYPVKAQRYAYQGIHPRSTDPALQKQVRMSFPHRFAQQEKSTELVNA